MNNPRIFFFLSKTFNLKQAAPRAAYKFSTSSVYQGGGGQKAMEGEGRISHDRGTRVCRFLRAPRGG